MWALSLGQDLGSLKTSKELPGFTPPTDPTERSSHNLNGKGKRPQVGEVAARFPKKLDLPKRLWVEKKSLRDHRFWSIFPLTKSKRVF